MITVSSDFNKNVDEGRTRVMLKLAGRILSDEDIASGGLRASEPLGPDGNYSIGNAPAGTISFELMNDDGRFSDMEYGPLVARGYATDGTETTVGTVAAGADAAAYSPYKGTSFIQTVNRFLRTDAGTLVYGGLPAKSRKAMLVIGARVYIMLEDTGDPIWMLYTGDGSWNSVNGITWDEADFSWSQMTGAVLKFSEDYQGADIRQLMERELKRGYTGFTLETASLREYRIDGGSLVSLAWEGCPIGVYDVERPAQSGGRTISCEGLGWMARLDSIEMDRYSGLFPINSGTLLLKVCRDAGLLGYKNYQTAFNVARNRWAGYSARQFVKDIAACTGANALVGRDGYIDFRKPTATAASYDESGYSAVEIAEFVCPQITGLTVKNSEADVGVSVGTDGAVMTIVDNPILAHLTQANLVNIANTILSRVDDLPAYRPTEASLWSGWQLEAGDIITIVRDSVSYSVPIFGVEYTITTGCRAVVTAGGEAERNDLIQSDRELFEERKKRYELSKTVDGLLSAVYDENGESRIVQQAGLISACVERVGGDASSVGWELTATEWSIKANGVEVLKVDKNGLTVHGNGEFSGVLTCTKLIINGQEFSEQGIIDRLGGGYSAYTWQNNGTTGYWSGGGGFGENCWGNSYADTCIDARYLRMPFGNILPVFTPQYVTIDGQRYIIPCVPPN